MHPTRILTAVALGAAVVASCTLNRNPHDDEGSSFPLEGVHAAIECEACHGDGGFESLPAACASCHEEDRPKRHHGQQDCGNSGCHTPVGWLATGQIGGDDDDDTPPITTPGDDDDDVTVPTTDTDTTTPGTTPGTTPTTPTGTGTIGHEFFPLVGVHAGDCLDCHPDFPTTDAERIVCTDCHEDDRKDRYHYAGQDCAHCHPMEAGWVDNSEQAFLLPHALGTVQECAECHPDPDDRAGNYVCTDCHEQGVTDADHAIFNGYSFESTACVGCHPDGA